MEGRFQNGSLSSWPEKIITYISNKSVTEKILLSWTALVIELDYLITYWVVSRHHKSLVPRQKCQGRLLTVQNVSALLLCNYYEKHFNKLNLRQHAKINNPHHFISCSNKIHTIGSYKRWNRNLWLPNVLTLKQRSASLYPVISIHYNWLLKFKSICKTSWPFEY